MDQMRVLIADDHPMFRHGLATLLEAQSDMQVIGEAASGAEVIMQAEALQPDVILMDIRMPEINGIEATRRILHISPHIRILIVTLSEDDASLFAAMRAGARGYILKDTPKDALLRAVRAIGRGEAIFSPAMATRLIDYFAAPRPPAPPQAFPDLTEREREILDLIARGLNNVEIAARLVLSHSTVRNYVSNIFSKLQVLDRAQAIVRARDAGLGREQPPFE